MCAVHGDVGLRFPTQTEEEVNEQRANNPKNGEFEIGVFDGFLDACFLSLAIRRHL